MKPHGLPRWDTGSVIRLLAILGSLGLYLMVTQWADHLELTFILILVGVLAGALVGTSRFSFWESAGIALILGTLSVYFLTANTLSIQTNFFNQEFNFIIVLGQGISELIHHLPVSSSLLFLTAVMTICWYLGYFGGFSLIRKTQPWIAIGLAGIAIVIIDLFLTPSRRNGTISAIFFFFILLLIARIFFIHSKEKWKRDKIFYDPETHFDLNRFVNITSLFIILIAWTIPIATKAFTQGTVEQLRFHAYIEKITQRWNNLFTPLKQSDNLTIYSDDDLLTIGNMTPSSEKILFSVQTDILPKLGTHYYWRARSYNSYDGSNWFNSRTLNEIYSSGNQLTPILNSGNPELVQFLFRANARIGIFLQGGLPGNINQSGVEIFFPASKNEKDVIAVLPEKTIEEGASYSADGWVVSPTVSDMENSPSVYPSWIIDQYLSISSTVPERVKQLAKAITANATNPYIKAQEVTMYLRLNMHYSNSIPEVPEGRDLVDWFLFDSKEGFCSQYASAEVILLRSLGIPARLVAGYSEGTFSQKGQMYTVRVKDSHAWPEVYFTNLGWVIFEPTTIFPQQVFPAGNITTEQTTPTAQLTTRTSPNSSNTSHPLKNKGIGEIFNGNLSVSLSCVLWMVLFFIIICLVIITYLFVRRQKRKGIVSFSAFINEWIRSGGGAIPQRIKEWENFLQMQTIEKNFRIVRLGLSRFDLPIRKSDTPQEQVQRLFGIIPESARPAKSLLKEYEKSVYGGRKPNLKESKKWIREIRRSILSEQIKRLFRKK